MSAVTPRSGVYMGMKEEKGQRIGGRRGRLSKD